MGLALPKHMRTDITPPVEFADAVEKYARRTNRHGTLRFAPPPVNCWVIELTLMQNDPARAAWQGQIVEEEPAEIVYLWRASTPAESSKHGREHLVGYKLDELGVTGMIELLERTDTFSGRGQYRSHKDAIRDQAYKAEKGVEKLVDEARADSVRIGLDMKGSCEGRPYLTVDVDFTKAPTTAPGDG